jgi:hypothetical protein
MPHRFSAAANLFPALGTNFNVPETTAGAWPAVAMSS